MEGRTEQHFIKCYTQVTMDVAFFFFLNWNPNGTIAGNKREISKLRTAACLVTVTGFQLEMLFFFYLQVKPEEN